MLSDLFLQLLADLGAEAWCVALVDDGYLVFSHTSQLHDVALGTLADGNDVVGLLQRLTELPGINLRVRPMVELGMTQEDKVVDGHHAADATLPDAYRQLTRQPMIELHTIMSQVLYHARHTPPCSSHALTPCKRETHIRTLYYLATQVGTSLVRRIEP